MALHNQIPECEYEQLGRTLYKSIEQAYSVVDDLKSECEVCEFDIKHHLRPSSNLSSKIVQYINSKMIFKYSISFQYKNVNFAVNIFKMDYETIENYIEEIKIAVITSLSDKPSFEDKITTKINIFLTELPKHLDVNVSASSRKSSAYRITPDDITSSYSTFDECINICVYRSEEWFKTLIYELFLSFTINLMSSEINFNNILSTTFVNVKANFSIAEPIIEFWARIYNVAFFTYHSSETLDEYIRLFQKNLEDERTFSAMQSTKLLSHFGIKYSATLNSKLSNVKKKYNENANAFGLYVMTSIMLYHFDRIIQWLDNKNKLFDVNKNERQLIVCAHYLSHGARDSELIEFFDSITDTENCNTSLRMSLFEV